MKTGQNTAKFVTGMLLLIAGMPGFVTGIAWTKSLSPYLGLTVNDYVL